MNKRHAKDIKKNSHTFTSFLLLLLVIIIHSHAFRYNRNLSGEIRFPDKLETIDDYAFAECCNSSLTKGITSISFGANSQLTKIGNQAFLKPIPSVWLHFLLV